MRRPKVDHKMSQPKHRDKIYLPKKNYSKNVFFNRISTGTTLEK